MDSIMQLASYPYDVLIMIGMFLGFIYLARNEKDSLVHIFKEVHQSNLDDIEEQEKEEALTTCYSYFFYYSGRSASFMELASYAPTDVNWVFHI